MAGKLARSRIKAAPRLAVLVTGEAGGPSDPDNHQVLEFVIDAKTGEILHQETKICNAVAGRVTGNATAGYGADACANEDITGIPYAPKADAKVRIKRSFRWLTCSTKT